MAARQSHAVEPAQAEIAPETPELGMCELRRLMIASAPGGRLEEHEVVVAEESGLTFMFVRSLKDAIYGQVWSALVVTLHDHGESGSSVAFYRVVLDATGNQRRLAVKRMPWDIINRKMRKVRENPLDEIAFLTRMQDPGHPNVVGLEEALDDGTTVYLATPFVGGVGGGEMFDWVADNYLNPAPEAVIRPLLRQILEGTGYMHSKGICHADMSLENTLVNPERTKASIIDFGMALQMPTDEQGRRCKSIPDGRRAKKSYCAPETHKGRDAYDGVKVDMFSVGCMAFMMFTGIPPFDEATRIDSKFRKSVYRGDLQGYLRDYGMGPLPEPVFRVLRKMMAYKPEDRPTPEELLEDPWFAPVGIDTTAEQEQVQVQVAGEYEQDLQQVWRADEPLEGGKEKANSDPPQLQHVLPILFTTLDSRSWCRCLAVNAAARNAVRALFSGLVPGGPRPQEGWTVPLDILTVKTDEAGVAYLAANECGITVHGAAENVENLKAVVIPPPQSGFITVEGEQYIATSPTLRCQWTGTDSCQGPWTVSVPLEEEDGLSNPTELSQVLRRGDELQDGWEVQSAELKPATRRPSMEVEVTHFSDVMTADRLREIEKRSTSSFFTRKWVWGATLFSRCVHVYNASSEAMTVLQVLPAVVESGKGGQFSLPLVGGGGGGTRDITIHDDKTIDRRQIAAWGNAVGGDGHEPPTDPAKFEALLGMRAMRVVPYTVTGSREENNLKVFPRDFFHCSVGYDYYLLQRTIDGSLRPRFMEGDVGEDMSEERKVMDIVNR